MLICGLPQSAHSSRLLQVLSARRAFKTFARVGCYYYAGPLSVTLGLRRQGCWRDKDYKAIEELARWFQTWRIEVNAEKSAAISFIYRKGRSPEAIARGTPPLRINNAPIPWQHTYKYLGITLDRNLHFRDHIKRVRKTAIFY
ncbi:RNA-directed DNA polymerase from mobile element jockey [Eumeta japonica]|uniref:RNA-directed DNA polymerase from mobile element jockey n=1 Tax=Eumeta variegata TaxID=151549 RepID=A0A4C1Z6B8_EUMVA|nr:RNA-directed DNA polymerase from mobile element jockey [Eumeta japonica]